MVNKGYLRPFRLTILIITLAIGLESANRAPIPVITTLGKTITNDRITVGENETVCFSGSSSRDPDGDSLTYLWDFGDNSTSSKEKNPCHKYVEAGTYTVRLTVDDGKLDYIPLLTGMTPANFKVPQGWTLVRTQDFESGLGANEFMCGSITTTTPHTGTHSCESKVWKDDVCTGWRLNQGVATTMELYISWYEYMEAQGRNNDEMWLMCIRKNFTSSDDYQTMRWQYLNKLGAWNTAFNITEGNLIFFCEGNTKGCPPSHAYYKRSVWQSVGFGSWRQWEVYWKGNTPGKQDGATIIYMNGQFVTSVTDTAFGGSVDMRGPSIFLGGPTYTKIEWGSKVSGSCSENVKELDVSISRLKDFNQPCRCPGQCPPNGKVPIFNRFVDDIIILQK
jgi:hypothetical protein